jgi:hypothetical protein
MKHVHRTCNQECTATSGAEHFILADAYSPAAWQGHRHVRRRVGSVVRTPTNYQKKGVLPPDFRQQDLQEAGPGVPPCLGLIKSLKP